MITEIWERNRKIKNNYGPITFIVKHEDGTKTIWNGFSREHIEILTRIEFNLNFIPKVISIKNGETRNKTK